MAEIFTAAVGAAELELADDDVELAGAAALLADFELLELELPQPARTSTTAGSARQEEALRIENSLQSDHRVRRRHEPDRPQAPAH